jgi:hypothetical protein
MPVEGYFRSLSQELQALKNRVRYLIEDSHWQTDGEWKESVLRQILRRHLGGGIQVGRGFVVCEAESTHQIDVLLFDSSKPVLFRDGDLVFVTPDATIGIIEVKTSLNASSLLTAARKQAKDIRLIREGGNPKAFSGLFAFEFSNYLPKRCLGCLADAAPDERERLDLACLGESSLIRFGRAALSGGGCDLTFPAWHSYSLDQMAAGYFLHNVIDKICPSSITRNQGIWFPASGRRQHCNGSFFPTWSGGSGFVNTR